MKRICLLVLIIFLAVCAVYAQQAGSIDLVLLLDTSTGMSSSYDHVNNYITGGFLKEFLRTGDTFHLIAFSGKQRLDVARSISGAGDLETIIGRMMLQYPVERGSNVSAALAYTEQYVSLLPARPKKIVLVTTGDDNTANLVSQVNQRLSNRNITLDFVRVTPGQPITNVPSSGRPQQQQGTGSREQGTVQESGGREHEAGGRDQGTVSGQQSTGVSESTDRTSTDGDMTTDRVSTGDTTGAQDRTTTDGTDTTISHIDGSGGHTADISTTGRTGDDTGRTTTDDRTAVTGTGDRTTDTTGTASAGTQGSQRSSSLSFASLPLIIGIILLLLLIIGLIMLIASRRLGSSPNRVMATVASGSSASSSSGERVDHSGDLARYAQGQSGKRYTPYQDRPSKQGASSSVVINPNGPLALNLFVEDQSTLIGKRNIHSLKSGYSLSVGGSKGDGFLIFLVPLPGNLGELKRNGSSLTFVPKKAKYFPDIGSNEVRDCLGKNIRIISDKNYELSFRFEMYEDPLIALNRMLNSIKVPG